MRVLLVQALSMENPSAEKVYPLGVVLLATYLLRGGHEVQVLDMNMEADPFAVLKERLLTFRPRVVGFSLRNIDPLGNKTSSLIPPFTAAVRLTAALLTEACLIAGGTGFSLFPARLMRELPELHYGFVGEAERALPLLLDHLSNPPPLSGLCRRDGPEIKIDPPATDFNMACYLPPSRDILPPSLYAGANQYVPALGIESKRGCPFTCAYCVYPALQGRTLRCRPPAMVVEEMAALQTQYGVARFHFTDPVLNIPAGHLEAICHEILRRGLQVRWDGFFREDFLTEEQAAIYAEAGCECFSFSPDGLCQEALDVLDKKLSEADILRAARIAAGTGVLTVYHFMVNVPGETKKTCAKAERFLELLFEIHSAKRNLGTIVLNNIRILPGTVMAERAGRDGVIGPGTDLLYPTYYNPPPFDRFRYRLETLRQCREVFMWTEGEAAK
ncbi:MAG TPA: B12 lower ligand biosynthesis radical SAM protein BzaD [Firmicutes bacterium]|nr:B12 lower ligand biosynthesis radical SAM protein BzaD [Bacillota bacterium]